MAIETETKHYRTCDNCKTRLPESREKRAWLSKGYTFENGHNGNQEESTTSLDLCLSCVKKAFPKLSFREG